MDYIALGRRVRSARLMSGLTQEELAETTKISISFMGHVERGTRKPSLKTMMALANALEVTMDELLRDSLVNAQIRHNIAWSKMYRQLTEAIERAAFVSE